MKSFTEAIDRVSQRIRDAEAELKTSGCLMPVEYEGLEWPLPYGRNRSLRIFFEGKPLSDHDIKTRFAFVGKLQGLKTEAMKAMEEAVKMAESRS